MSATEGYRLCAVKVGTVTIGQIVDQELSDEVNEFLARDSASLYNRDQAVDLEDMRIRFSTEALKTALAKITLAGLDLATNNALCYFAKYTSGGQLDASGCVTFTIAKGLALWRGMNAAQGSLASASFEIIGVSPDGTTAPAIKATGVALPTIATKEMYVIAGSTGVQSASIDTGIAEFLSRGDGDAFYTFAAIDGIQPEAALVQATMGTVGAITNISTITLDDLTSGGYRGSSPIIFTFNQLMANARRIGGNPVLTEYRIRPTWDGTNAPIVVSGLS